MNLAQMLAAPVTPLSAYEPTCQKRQRAAAKAKREADKLVAKQERTKAKREPKRSPNGTVKEQALANYRAAWHDDEWVSTAELRARLTRGRSCCLNILRKWEEQKLVESRDILGKNGRPIKHKGVEWRWK